MFGAVERQLQRRVVLARLGEERTFCTSPFIVVPNVRLNVAERVEEGRHHLLAIGAVGQRREGGEAGLIELDASCRRSA